MDFDQALLALGTAAIPGDAPAGVSARYEPEFESMQAEIEKLTGLSGETPNWSLVVDNASTILAAKSKDLLAACYLCAGLRETRGWSGLADGLNLIKALCANFWEGLQPAKLRVRRTAIDWLLERLNTQLPAMTVASADADALAACLTLIDELVAFGENRWEGDAPTLWSLSSVLKERQGALPAAPAAEAGAPDSQDSTAGPVGAPAGASSVSIPGGAVTSRADVFRQILAAAAYIEATEPHSPVSYLLRRAAAWGTMPLPQLYAELQRAGTVWDLVLQQPAPGGRAPESAGAIAATPAPSAPAEAAPARPRGDY